MNLFLEILTIVIFIFLIKESFTIHMGLICAYDNTPIILLTMAYGFIISTLSRKNIIQYYLLHIIIISIITILILVIFNKIEELKYKKTHPRDEQRLTYERVILDVMYDRIEDSLDNIFCIWGMASAFTDILKFYDLEDEKLRKITNDVLDIVPIKNYDNEEYEKIQEILLKDYPIKKEEN